MTICHDQGQTAFSLPELDRDTSVLADLLLPVTTPARDAAFDVAGRAKANVVPASNAFAVRLNMARSKVAATGVITGKESEVESIPA